VTKSQEKGAVLCTLLLPMEFSGMVGFDMMAKILHTDLLFYEHLLQMKQNTISSQNNSAAGS
jgi:hypothetical protein